MSAPIETFDPDGIPHGAGNVLVIPGTSSRFGRCLQVKIVGGDISAILDSRDALELAEIFLRLSHTIPSRERP
jgi:hypothetical protein